MSTSPAHASPKAAFFFGGLMGFVAGIVVAGVLAIWIYQASPYRAEVNPSARVDVKPRTEGKPKVAETGQAVIGKEEGKPDALRVAPPSSILAPGGTNPLAKVAEKGGSSETVSKSADAKTAAGSASSASEPAPSAEPRGRLWLQVGAYANRAEADSQRARFAVMGYEAQIQATEVPDKGTMHRVRIGPFKDPDEASKVRSELARQGIEVSVVRPSAN